MHHHAWEVGSCLICLLPWVGWEFQTCLEQIFKQFELLWFSIECGHCHCEGFRQFGDTTDVVVEIGWIIVPGQLLEGQQNLVYFNCGRCVLTAKLWLTCGARLFLFFWRSTRGALGNLFWNSCVMWGRLRISFGPLVNIWGYSSTSGLFRLPEWREEYLISGKNRLKNDPQWVPGFLSCCS